MHVCCQEASCYECELYVYIRREGCLINTGFFIRAGTQVIYPAIVEEGRFLLSVASANDRPAFA